MRGRRIPAEVVEEIVRRYDDGRGESMRAIALALGWSYGAVHRIVTKHRDGLTANGEERTSGRSGHRAGCRCGSCRAVRLRDLVAPEVIARYRGGQVDGVDYPGGETIEEIARAVSVGYGTVHRILVAAKVEIRHRGSTPLGPPVDPAEVVTRYIAGESIGDLTAALCTSYGTVRRRLIAAGVERRPAGRPRMDGGRQEQ